MCIRDSVDALLIGGLQLAELVVGEDQLVAPVSYTHVDVYKRQHLEIRVNGQRTDPEAKFPDLNLSSW